MELAQLKAKIKPKGKGKGKRRDVSAAPPTPSNPPPPPQQQQQQQQHLPPPPAEDDGPRPLNAYVDVITKLGRRFATCCRPWPPPKDWTWTFSERPLVNVFDLEARYPEKGTDSEKSAALGRAYAAEIYDFLPANLRGQMTNPYFWPPVRLQLSSIGPLLIT